METTSVVYRHPFTGVVSTMPAGMIEANLYSFGPPLNLEDAARIAHKRDEENATNFLLSVEDACSPILSINAISEGSPFDLLTIQPPM